MTGTVIDSLVVTLGLDPTQFTKKQAEALDAFKKFHEEMDKRLKGVEKTGADASNSLSELRNQAVGIFAAFSGGRGVLEFAGGIVKADASIGRLSRNLGISTQTLSVWQSAARIFGGSAEGMAASFTAISDAVTGFAIGKVSPMIQDFRALSTAGGTLIDVNKGVDQTLLDIAANLKAINAQDKARAGLLGRMLGLDPGLYDLLVQGPVAAQKLLDKMKQLGPTTKEAADAAGEFEKRLNAMAPKAEAIGRNILNSGVGQGVMDLADLLNLTPGQIWENLTKTGTWLGRKGPVAEKTTTVGGNQMSNYAAAIAAIESRGSGGYSAVGPVTASGDRAYGKYQVMGNNIGPWSEAAIGRRLTPAEFLNSPEAQDSIFRHKFGEYVTKFGNPQDAASAWFTGRPLSGGGNARDVLGTSGLDYVNRFNSNLRSGSGSVVNNNITVNVPAGSDGNQIGSAVVDHLRRQSDAANANGGSQ